MYICIQNLLDNKFSPSILPPEPEGSGFPLDTPLNIRMRFFWYFINRYYVTVGICIQNLLDHKFPLPPYLPLPPEPEGPGFPLDTPLNLRTCFFWYFINATVTVGRPQTRRVYAEVVCVVLILDQLWNTPGIKPNFFSLVLIKVALTSEIRYYCFSSHGYNKVFNFGPTFSLYHRI